MRGNYMNVLIVDDALEIRTYLSELMIHWGYQVFQASNGQEALQLVFKHKFQIVIVDWMMPEMDGLELCKQIRDSKLGYYVYMIMLTSRKFSNDLVTSLSAGADDFISKPINPKELRARIRSAERVVGMEHAHTLKHDTLHNEHQKIKSSYEKVQEELEAAAKIQHDLLPECKTDVLPIKLDWFFTPASHIGGDFFNYFIDDQYLCFYLIDIAGHGISAAMYGIYLNRLLSPGKQNKSGLVHQKDTDFFTSPVAVVSALNQELCQPGSDYSGYLTMIYGVINRNTGQGELCRAGHPYPFISHTDGKLSILQKGNLPVGLFAEADYQSQTFQMQTGEKLIMFSDGVTDCVNSDQEQFSISRFTNVLEQGTSQPGNLLMDEIQSAVNEWRGSQPISDDISIMSITYN
jgi:sigma-B regulation protein RsbU (phosphoserine phosphatase)